MNLSWGSIFLLQAVGTMILYAQTTDISAVAAGNGVTDDTNIIQSTINSSPVGTTISFGGASKTYLISHALVFQPDRTYTGAATLTMSPLVGAGGSMATVPSNVTINGLTFNGSGIAGVISFADGLNPIQNVVVQNCSFLNTESPAGLSNGPISATSGIINAFISNNTFSNVGQVYASNPSGLTISNNVWNGLLPGADVISIKVAGPGLGSVSITGNSATSLGRMAIEIQALTANTELDNLTIANNVFSSWSATADPNASYGISLAFASATNSIVSGNTLVLGSAIRQSGYGIEAGASGIVIDNNTITGWFDGIILNNGSGISVTNNHLNSQVYSIELSGGAPELDETIQNNTISNSQIAAIDIRNDAGGSTIQGNVINRAAGFYPGDSTATFTGIFVTAVPSGTRAVTISSNQFVQTAPVVSSGFTFTPFNLPQSALFMLSSNVFCSVAASGTCQMVSTPPPSSPIYPGFCPAPGWGTFAGCYYVGTNFNTLAFGRTDSAINFNWNSASPDPSLPVSGYSVEWAGNFTLPAGTYTFTVLAGDGVRLFVDSAMILNQWANSAVALTYTPTLTLGNGSHLFRLIYYHNTGPATIQLSWEQGGSTPPPAPPGLTLTSPVNGTMISGTTVTVNYTRSGSYSDVDHISWQLDGNTSLADTAMTGSYQFVNVADGSHTLIGYLARANNTAISGTNVSVSFTTSVLATPPTSSQIYPGFCPAPGWGTFTGCYYVGTNFNTLAFGRTDSAINFNWNSASPDPSLPVSGYSVEWAGNFTLPAGTYTFTVLAGDGVRLFVDSAMILNQWANSAVALTYTPTLTLGNGSHLFRLIYYHNTGPATIQLSWEQGGSTPPPAPPGLTLTSPVNGTMISGTTVTVNYTRSGSYSDVDHISWQLDGNTSLADTAMTGSYQFVNVADGSHTLIGYLARANNTAISGTNVSVSFSTSVLATPPTSSQIYPGFCPAPGWGTFTGCYYVGTNFNTLAFGRTDSAINFNWNSASPDPSLPVSGYSVEWAGNFTLPAGTYTFTVLAGDGVRLFVDSAMILNQWANSAVALTYTPTLTLGNGSHLFRLIYYHNTGPATIQLSW